MSIVITVIDSNKKLYMASDKRRVRGSVVADDCRKIFPIKENIYFGMTGIYETGLAILSLIKEIKWNKRIELIKESLHCFDTTMPQKMTMTIAGKDEEGFFIFQRSIEGDKADIKITEGSGNIEFAINAGDKISDFEKYFVDKIKSGETTKASVIKTIEYASTIDASISSDFELYEVG